MDVQKGSSKWVWLDLETTGLDVERRAIVEIATIVTDNDLTIIAEGPTMVIRQSEEVLAEMDEWCAEQHRVSGLLEAVRRSSITLADAEERTLAFLQEQCPPRACPLAGNSICFDRRFLIRHMPRLETHLHYRNIDVSTVKELAYRWFPGITPPFEKRSLHRALPDILESIEELRFYRSALFSESHVRRNVA